MRTIQGIGLVLAVAFMSACDEPTAPEETAPPTFAMGGVAETAQGSGHVMIDGQRRTFTFSARRGEDGSATGSFAVQSRQTGQRVLGDVVCMTRWGGTVWVGGVINSGDFAGRGAVFRVMDGGAGIRGVPDLISLAQTTSPEAVQSYCDVAPPTPPLVHEIDGNITVSEPGTSSFTAVDRMDVDDFPVFVPCADDGNGELVLFSGALQFLFHFNDDRAGGFHVTSETNPQGMSGIGPVTGDLYQGTGGTGGHTNGAVSGFPYTDSFVNNFRIIGQGTGNDLIVHVNGQFTVNALGEVTVSHVNATSECR